MQRNRTWILGTILLIVIIGGALVWPRSSKPASSLTPISLAMDWTPNTDHTGIYVAEAKGWYKDAGLKLNILPYSANVLSTDLVQSGKADVAIGATEDVISQSAKGDRLVSIGALVQHNTSGFIVRADSGVNSPKDLDGKVYGGYGSLGESAVVTEVIKKAGGQGNFKDVTLNVDAMQALESKQIDFVWGFAGWEVLEAKADGVPVKFFPITSYGIPDGPNLSFVATPRQISQEHDKLQRFMTATARGYEYARQHPHESAQLLIAGTPKGTFANTALVYNSQSYLSAHYADPGHKWGVEDAAAWTGYPKFMLASGVIDDAAGKPTTKLNFAGLYTNQFLQ